ERFLTLHRRAHIGFIFQQFHLMPYVRVTDNIGVPLLPLGIPPKERGVRTLELLEKLNLTGRKDFYARQLSGGEQQRVAIARALINDPSIILADEPTAHLDTQLSSEFLGILASLKEEGRTVIIASHDPQVFEAGSVDRVYEMRDGRIVGVEG
ncbi:MAG: ABC transporter ATP-binding protein, partial [Nitrospinota bacterium]